MSISSTSNREFRTRALELGLVAALFAISSAIGAAPSWAQTTPDKSVEKPVRAVADSSAKALADLPPAVLPAISSVLGRADARYGMQETVDGYSAQNAANHLTAHFAAKGVEIRSQNGDWGFEFQGWGYGKHTVNKNKAAVAPSVNANRVEYRRGALTEWYVNGPLGIEQGFTISQPPVALPDSNDDALDIALHLSGNLSASVEPGRRALVLRNEKGAQALRYGPLLVYDASGRELESWMEVQDGGLRLRVNTDGARYPIIVDPWVQAAQLTNSLGATGDQLGRSIAIDATGDTVVVGDTQAKIGSNAAQGAVYVFVKPASGWATTSTFTAELTASDGAAGDAFGLSVGINESGNTVVVGAPLATIGSNMIQGAAYVFVEPTSGSWATTSTFSAKLTASDAAAGDEFSWSVGINETGNTIVAGDFNAKIGSNTVQGAAYVFVEPASGGWATTSTFSAKLTASDGAENDAFGLSVGISGNTIVVGAIQVSIPILRQGAVYVFVEPASGGWVTPTTNPTFAAKLTASDATANSFLGWSVGISGNTIVAGAYQTTIGSNAAQGAAYVFVEPTGGWLSGNQTAELTASDGVADDEFGTSVGISGNTVVVGAPNAKFGSNTRQGVAYVFVEPTGAGGWASAPSENETAELTASGGAASSLFGTAVSIGGSTIVASAPDATVGSNSTQGAAYVFTQEGAEPTLVFTATTGSGQSAMVNTQFASPLGVTVLDGNGHPPANAVTVTFTAPASGASGSFAGGVNTAVTDATGMATSTVFTANGIGGSYTVTASAPNVTGTATFAFTNAAAQSNTTVTVSASSSDHGDALPSNDALVGNPITVSFKVAQASGNVTPTGSVVVSDGVGDTCVQSPVVLTPASAGAGSCTLTITTLPSSGSATLTATYTPNTNAFSGSAGNVVESVVEISACGPPVPEQVVSTGAQITYSFNVCVSGNANAQLPVVHVVECVPRGSCKTTITQMGQTGVDTVAVTIVTSCGDCKALLVPQPRSWPGPWRWPLTLICLGALLAMLMARRLARQNPARPRLLYAAGFLLALLLCGMPACSGNSNDTPVGTYTVSVEVVAGNFNVAVPVNVMVKK